MIEVYGAGRTPNRVMLIGEAPGATEAARSAPFVGKSGQEQARLISRFGGNVRSYYRTNVVKEYRTGNPDPTAAQLDYWSLYLRAEIRKCDPYLIIAVGRFATRWLLGENVDMAAVHGKVQLVEIEHYSYTVVPVYHPASGFYNADLRTLISADYRAAVAAIDRGIAVFDDVISDDHLGEETYIDVTGTELADHLDMVFAPPDWGKIEPIIGLDTEGYSDAPWSIQISTAPGHGLVLRTAQPDFAVGISRLQDFADAGGIIAIHNAMYDIEMSRSMGLDLSDATIFDSMYAAYLTRIEPQALKSLAARWTGMSMMSYRDVIGNAAVAKQLDWLGDALDLDLPDPEPQLEQSNDGTARLKQPQHIHRRVDAILIDWYAEKLDKNGARIDIAARWAKCDAVQVAAVEHRLGPMPIATLADIPLPDAIHYSARDADATLRLVAPLTAELDRLGLTDLMVTGMVVLPIFEEMQSNGMPASRDYFAALSDEMTDSMATLQQHISHRHFSGRPFNPASPKQVATLMRRRGLSGAKRTATGAISTSKKSIEHLRFSDPAIGLVMDWREMAKVRDSFCAPVLARIPSGTDIAPIRCSIKTTRVATRRISAANPNLLAIPIRNDLGRRVRDGYIAPDGETFGAWDLSQVEMRVMAHLSEDEFLCRLLNERRDIHSETAARIFGIDIRDVDKMKHRYPAKRAGFGIITNISGAGLYDQLRMFGCNGWSVDLCDDLVRDWLRLYSGVATFLDLCKREVRRTGEVRDVWGMPRYLPGVWSDDRHVRAEAERAASSHKIQGGAQGMIQRSMAWLRPHIRALQLGGDNVHWLLQIHDELLLRFDEDLWDTLDPLILEALTEHSGLQLRVPLEAESERSRTWGGLK